MPTKRVVATFMVSDPYCTQNSSELFKAVFPNNSLNSELRVVVEFLRSCSTEAKGGS